MTKMIRAGAVQAEPVWLDIEGSVDKTIQLISQSAADGVQLLVFPELWIPGYPVFQSYTSTDIEIPYVIDYRSNSLSVGSEQMARIRSAARVHGVHLVLGFAERDGRSLYMSQALIDDRGDILFVRRKLKPTYQERCLFGQGDGSDLQVADTALGRVGALNCYEHLQPLTKFAMMGLGEQIHASSWPILGMFGGEMMSGGTITAVARAHAIESGTFVLMSSAVFTDAGRKTFSRYGAPIPEFRGGGFGNVFGPDGGVLATGPDPGTEGIVAANLDLTTLEVTSFFTDPVGHYSRPDVFSLAVDVRRRRPVDFSARGESGAIGFAAPAPVEHDSGVAAQGGANV
jgi:nitrilase